jgi:hypothetical protein
LVLGTGEMEVAKRGRGSLLGLDNSNFRITDGQQTALSYYSSTSFSMKIHAKSIGSHIL